MNCDRLGTLKRTEQQNIYPNPLLERVFSLPPHRFWLPSNGLLGGKGKLEKYLYLTELSWVDPWVTGGNVPLKIASTYKSIERQGIYTPDENLIDSSTHDVNMFKGALSIENSDVTIYGAVIDGVPYREVMKFDRKIEDGLVLCLANRRSNYIAKRLKKKTCVKIFDVNKLKKLLDDQIGVESQMGPCSYTDTHHRHHFLKSDMDAWQEEFRLFWPGVGSTSVNICKGMGEIVPVRGNMF